MAFVQRMLSSRLIPVEQRHQALNRIRADPGIPNASGSNAPFWLEHPHLRLAEIQSDVLPSNADVVIIGSGIAGASVAKSLLQSAPRQDGPSIRPKVVIVEARDVCSGATGRNGGHILEGAEEFADLVEKIGLEAAKKVMRLRLSHLHDIMQVAEEFSLIAEAQVRRVKFLSAYFDDARWEEVTKSIAMFKKTMPKESCEWKIVPQQDIPKEYSLSHAVGIIAGPAGALWPYKFVTGLLAALLERYPTDLHIETNTPVTAVNRSYIEDSTDLFYNVVTSRGPIRCRHVVHCTNAHVTHLVPSLRDCIYPIRGHMSAQTPGDGFSFQGATHSWMFNYEAGFDYLTQLPPGPHSTDEMMLGGGFVQGEFGGITDIGVATDDEMSVAVQRHLSHALGHVFMLEDGKTYQDHKVKCMWSGNMGFSVDGFPWVGRLAMHPRERLSREDTGSEWVCAAFSGEGMVHAWKCGTALAIMLLGGSHDDDELSWFPEQMLVTEDRVKRATLLGATADMIEKNGRLNGCVRSSSVVTAPERTSALP